VHGYKKIDIEVKEKDLPTSFQAKSYTQASYIEIAQATYSIGVATACVVDKLKAHGVTT
jgi:hypothetical protein